MKSSVKVFVLMSFVFISIKANDIENSLSIVDRNNDEKEVTVDEEVSEGPEDTEPFIPSNEWQIIHKGQVIPAGLHVRVNLETGLKEAKILDKNSEEIDKNVKFIDKHKKVIETENRVNSKVNEIRDQMKQILQNMKFEPNSEVIEPKDQMMDSDKSSSDFRSIDEIKKDFDEMNIKMHSESDLLKSLLEKYQKSSNEEKMVLLSDIEYLVHSIDIAQDFVKMNGIDLLIPALNSTDSRLRAQIAFTIGSAMNANPKVQIEVLKRGVLKELLLLLRYDSSFNVKKRALFAISCLVRQFPSAQKSLIEEYGGLSVFANIFRVSDINSIKLSAKVVTILNDLLIERQLTSKYATNDKLSQIKLKQYEEIALNEAIVRERFCSLIPNLLNFEDNDIREKTIEAMKSLLIICKTEFIKSLPILQTISMDFNNLSKSETKIDSSDNYFKNLYQLTSNLINELNINLKDEF